MGASRPRARRELQTGVGSVCGEPVSDRRAVREHEHLRRHLHDVREGKIGEIDVPVGEISGGAEARHGGAHVGVRQHDALGRAGGARGVHDHRRVRGLGRDGIHGLTRAARRDVAELLVRHAARELRHGLLGHVAHRDNVLEAGAVSGDGDEILEELSVADHHSSLGLVDAVLHALGAEGGVDGDHRAGLREDRLGGELPLHLRVRVNHHAVLRLDRREVDEAGGEIRHLMLHLREGVPAVIAQRELLEPLSVTSQRRISRSPMARRLPFLEMAYSKRSESVLHPSTGVVMSSA